MNGDMLLRIWVCFLQVELWKKYITWEKSNPLRTEDHATITKRGVYKKRQIASSQCIIILILSISNRIPTTIKGALAKKVVMFTSCS